MQIGPPKPLPLQRKALFITTGTADALSHVKAWDQIAATPAVQYTFPTKGMRSDNNIIAYAEAEEPDIIFYIGAVNAPCNPRIKTFQRLREIAPSINLCSDATDRPWHPVLKDYAGKGCFTLQVGIDGPPARCPVDLRTLTPVPPYYWHQSHNNVRDIPLGFSGTAYNGIRGHYIRAMVWFGDLEVRPRIEEHDSYEAHAAFLKRCRVILNVSFTGTAQRHHIKGRVLEAGHCGAALLESAGSPIGDWFPDDCFIMYEDPPDAIKTLADMPSKDIEQYAAHLNNHVRDNYTAIHIYTQIIEAADACS